MPSPWLLLFLLAVRGASAKPPVAVSACDLLRNPQQYDGKLVRVRAQAEVTFENSLLTGADCHADTPGLWLEYGRGPRRQPTVWCCGSMTPRDSMKLIDDRKFRQFDEAVRENRLLRVTLTGRVDALPTERCPHGTEGFGHLGTVCARFVIRQVESFDAVP